MFDSYLRTLINPPLNVIGKRIASYGITANSITLIGLICGLVAIVLISFNQYSLAIFCIGLNRILDGLDGAVARHTNLTDFGGLLDIVCDFIVYSGIVFAFGIANPKYAFPAAFLIFSFIGPISTFLAYATIAAKRGISSESRGEKSFYYLGGICEGSETAFILLLMCILPNYFPQICFTYGILCWITTFGRIHNAWNDFVPTRK